jgi:hypothetical protein
MAGGVQDGQAVNAAVTDAAFLFKNGDDATLAKLGFNDLDVSTVSGAVVVNGQREFNALWSWLGGALNQIKTYLPTWASSFYGTVNDTIKQRIEAIDAAFNPNGGALSSRAGTVAIGGGALSVTVAFSTAWPDTLFVPQWNFENLVDAGPIALQGRITARTVNGFTVSWDSPTDTTNYKLNYTVRKAS